jgi:hypothetical protein
MIQEIRGLVRLALGQNLLRPFRCFSLRTALGDHTGFMAFAQKFTGAGLARACNVSPHEVGADTNLSNRVLRMTIT